MKKYMLLIAMVSLVFAHSQNVENVQREIDKSLWKPFKEAFEDLNAEELNSLYAEEVIRVTPNGIDTENSFKNANFKRLNGHKENNTDLRLDFWFDSRHSNENTSYEVGFYRMTLSNSEGVTTIYGQFHIVLEKIDGLWKITQDWDASSINGRELAKEDFEKHKPIQFD